MCSSDLENGIPGIHGIDTRALVKRLRTRGSTPGTLSTAGLTDEEAVRLAREWGGMEGRDYVTEVTHKEAFDWDPDDRQSPAFALVQGNQPFTGSPREVRNPMPPADIPIVAFDFGVKYNILRRLRQKGFKVHVVPAHARAADVLARKPAGVFLSNGPGDPAALSGIVREVRTLIDSGIPIFGICLGHQILGQALGGKTFKLKFGHRGGNQPVKDLETGRVEITSQNHGFAVDPSTLPDSAEMTHINLNDNTCAGIALKDAPAFAVQYHPEASPGPHDSDYLFDQFVSMM